MTLDEYAAKVPLDHRLPEASYYPPNKGFSGSTNNKTLPVGTKLMRYGIENSNSHYFAPNGSTAESLSLPYGTNTQIINYYELIQPLNVESGLAAPWFSQPGGGVQYWSEKSLQELIRLQIIK